MEPSVPLKNDLDSRNILQDIVLGYYENAGRAITRLGEDIGSDDWLQMDFLVDRRHVIRVAIGNDPNPQGDRWLTSVSLAFGPYFIGPFDFWSFDNATRFSRAAERASVIHNLALLDEYWGVKAC